MVFFGVMFLLLYMLVSVIVYVGYSYNAHRYAWGLRRDKGSNDVSVMRQRFGWLRIVVGSCS